MSLNHVINGDYSWLALMIGSSRWFWLCQFNILCPTQAKIPSPPHTVLFAFCLFLYFFLCSWSHIFTILVILYIVTALDRDYTNNGHNSGPRCSRPENFTRKLFPTGFCDEDSKKHDASHKQTQIINGSM